MDVSSYSKVEAEALMNRINAKLNILHQVQKQFMQSFPNAENDFVNMGLIGLAIECNHVISDCESRIEELITPKETIEVDIEQPNN